MDKVVKWFIKHWENIFIISFTVVIAWLSTSVHEPRINLIVVDRDRFQQVIQRVRDAGYRITRFNSPRGANAGQGTANVNNQDSENSSPGKILNSKTAPNSVYHESVKYVGNKAENE